MIRKDKGRRTESEKTPPGRPARTPTGIHLLNMEAYADILDNISDGAYIVNPKGYFQFMNKTLRKRYDLQPHQYREVHFLDLIDPGYHAQAKKNFKRVMGGGDGIPYELRVTDNNGRIKFVEIHSRPVRENGKVAGILGTSRDITTRKLAEEALQKSQELLAKLISALPDAILQTDINGRIVYVNEIGLRLSGYGSMEELVGQEMLSFVVPEDRKKAKEQLALLMERKVGSINEYRLFTRDGGTVVVEGQGAVLLDNEGHPYGRIYSCRDITERKRTEQQLWENQERSRLAMEAGKQGCFDWDVRKDNLYYCDQFLNLLGYKRDELEPRIQSWKKLIHTKDKEAVLRALRSHMEGRKGHYEATYRLKVKSGEWRWFKGHAEVVSRDEKGRPLRMMGTIADVTDYKVLEEELERKVAERTHELTEVNTALKVLLKHREQDIREAEERMVANLKLKVLPYVSEMRKTGRNVNRQKLFSLVNESIEAISSPFMKTLSSRHATLSPRELQVAEMIRSGRSSKEIAELIGISSRTVDLVRHMIRRKLDLVHKRANLKSSLSSIV